MNLANMEKCVFIVVLFFVLLFNFANACFADTHYASPGDNLTTKVNELSAGDTLILHDGNYTNPSSNNIVMEVGVTGASNNWITIKADHDGMAVVDGQNQSFPFVAYSGNRYINIEGIRFQNANDPTAHTNASVLRIYGSYMNFRRVSAYNSGWGNAHDFEIGGASYVLLEDCAASGQGRNNYLIHESSYVTLRRCWGKWMSSNQGESNEIGQLYAANNSTIENLVGTVDPNYTAKDIDGWSYWIASWNNPTSCYNNKITDSVFYNFHFYDIWQGQEQNASGKNLDNNSLINTVLIGAGSNSAILSRGGRNYLFDKVTIANNGNRSNLRLNNQFGFYTTTATIKNSSLINGGSSFNVESGTNLNHSYNNFYNVTPPNPGTGEISINPGYNTTKYGKGAYLIRPDVLKGKGENLGDIGAQVIYRTVNGTQTAEPLWPWPMEERIQKEMKELFSQTVSVTWETVNGVTAGGLWKTLDGVYSALSPTPTVRPSPTPTQGTGKPGDLNKDGQVDIADLVIVGSNFGKTTNQGDANDDGVVNINDLVIVGANFGK